MAARLRHTSSTKGRLILGKPDEDSLPRNNVTPLFMPPATSAKYAVRLTTYSWTIAFRTKSLGKPIPEKSSHFRFFAAHATKRNRGIANTAGTVWN